MEPQLSETQTDTPIIEISKDQAVELGKLVRRIRIDMRSQSMVVYACLMAIELDLLSELSKRDEIIFRQAQGYFSDADDSREDLAIMIEQYVTNARFDREEFTNSLHEQIEEICRGYGKVLSFIGQITSTESNSEIEGLSDMLSMAHKATSLQIRMLMDDKFWRLDSNIWIWYNGIIREILFRLKDLETSILPFSVANLSDYEESLGVIFSAKATPTEIGLRIRAARENKGWSQLRLAQEMGLKSKMTVQNLEQGKHSQTITSVAAAMNALGINNL